MTLDHIGAEFFPATDILRIIGRVAFPIFSFFIFTGFKYTRSRLNYMLRILAVGILCVIVYMLYSGEMFGNIFITFSLSICVLYCLQKSEDLWRTKEPVKRAAATAVLTGSLAAAFIICKAVYIDYGFVGVLLPFFAKLFSDFFKSRGLIKHYEKYHALIGFSVGLVLLSADMGGLQPWCLLSLPLLSAYSGERGRYRMKYFFYLFYPIHLAAIGIASMKIKG